MKYRKPEKANFVFGLIIILLVVSTAIPGIFMPGTYRAETLNWRTQSTGQDIFDLFVLAPAYLICFFPRFSRTRASVFLRGGILLFLFYTYLIYCFSVHFNQYFLIYCATLFCVVNALANFFWNLFILSRQYAPGPVLKTRAAAVFFILISVMFCILWLSEIIPAIYSGHLPASVAETGLPVNPVHVLDLAFFLPSALITGVFLWKKNKTAVLVTPVLLAFFSFMSLNIGILVIVMNHSGVSSDISIAGVMAVLAAISIVLFIRSLRNFNPPIISS